MDVIAERADIDAAVSGKTVCTVFAEAVRNGATGRRCTGKRMGNGDP